jgi:hypothetical protein
LRRPTGRNNNHIRNPYPKTLPIFIRQAAPKPNKMLLPTVLAALVATAAAAKDSRTFAVLRHYGQGPLTTCRADPIVSPGSVSAHVHTIMGASNFALNVTGEELRESSCTTAMPKGDLSAYWFPTLYFQDPETKLLEQVKMFYMNVYYL